METQEAEVVEIDLKSTIERALVKQNVTDTVIAGLKEKYGGLKLVSVDDKESYLEVKAGKREVAKWRTLTEKICKKGREDAIAVQRLWLAKEKEVVGKISEVEEPLAAEMKRFEDEEERRATEIKRLQEEAYMQRSQALSRMGAVYSDGSFSLNGVSYEANLIKESDESTWANIILPKYDREYQKVEAERIEQERIRTEKEAEMQRQQKEFEEQQRLFREQQEQFKKQQEEAQRLFQEQEREKNEAIRRQQQDLLNQRAVVLSGLGMRYDGQQYIFEDVNVHSVEMVTLDEGKWVELVAKITTVIAERKQQAEEKRAAKIAEDILIAKEQAAHKERERIEEEQRQQELKKQQEQQRKADELAQANDKTKWESLLAQLDGICITEMGMKSGIYKRKVQIMKEKIEEIKAL